MSAEDIGQDILHQLDSDRSLDQRAVRLNPIDRAFQLADVARDFVGQELNHPLGDVDVQRLGLGRQDAHAQLKVRRMNVSNQSPTQARAQALL